MPIQSSTPLRLLDWVAGSFLVCVLATNGAWLAVALWRRAPGRPRAGVPVRLLAQAWPVLREAGRLVFFLGIPYLVLGGWPRPPMQGLLSLDDLGLAGLGGTWPVDRWLDALGTSAGVGVLALLLLLAAWVNANRPADGLSLRFPARPWWSVLIDVIYLEVHWAFYRAALSLVLGDLYAAVWLGLGLACLEWALNPFWRQGWRVPGHAAGQWLQVALALVVAFLFLLTRNLWGCLGVHLLVELACRWIGREPARKAGVV